MIKILNLQVELFSKERISLYELTRKAQDLVIKYESYLSENPNDIPALFLANFSADQHDHALGLLTQLTKTSSRKTADS